MTEHAATRLVKLCLVMMIFQLCIIAYVFYTEYSGRVAIVKAQRISCERGKQDRKDNSDFQNAHKKYIDKVVLAQSVKEDVKRAAREAEETYNRTSVSLTERSRINCNKATPSAKLIP